MIPTLHPDVAVAILFQTPARRGSALRVEVIDAPASGRTPALRLVTTRITHEHAIILDPTWRVELRRAIERWCELCDAHEHGLQAPEVTP